jgi:hypothetical protein
MAGVLFLAAWCCGWISTLLWIFSYFPQIYENLKRKEYPIFLIYSFSSVSGASFEFMLINPQGFVFYSIYLHVGIYFPELGTGECVWSDAIFSDLCLLLTCFTLYQTCTYKVPSLLHEIY